MADRKLPPFEKVGSEQRNGQTWLHVRLKVPEKNVNPKELPQYWLMLDSQGHARLVRDPDGSVSYAWGSDEPQTAKSPPAAAVPDESDGDLVNRGIEKAENGDLDGAIADFDRAAERNPKDDAPYYNRAQAKRLKNDTAGAIADYIKGIELGSTNPAAYNNRGNARAETKDRYGAIADYTRAIELKPDYAHAYYNRAMLKKEKGDAAGAAADFERARELDPELVTEGSAPDSSSNRSAANGLDCEGEYAILLGMPGDIFRRIRTIIFEFHKIEGFRPMLSDTCVKLKRLGYTVTQHDGDIMSAVLQRIRSRGGSDACE
jgi:tetratricopeptide (TPR) repeat protein